MSEVKEIYKDVIRESVTAVIEGAIEADKKIKNIIERVREHYPEFPQKTPQEMWKLMDEVLQEEEEKGNLNDISRMCDMTPEKLRRFIVAVGAFGFGVADSQHARKEKDEMFV